MIEAQIRARELKIQAFVNFYREELLKSRSRSVSFNLPIWEDVEAVMPLIISNWKIEPEFEVLWYHDKYVVDVYWQ